MTHQHLFHDCFVTLDAWTKRKEHHNGGAVMRYDVITRHHDTALQTAKRIRHALDAVSARNVI